MSQFFTDTFGLSQGNIITTLRFARTGIIAYLDTLGFDKNQVKALTPQQLSEQLPDDKYYLGHALEGIDRDIAVLLTLLDCNLRIASPQKVEKKVVEKKKHVKFVFGTAEDLKDSGPLFTMFTGKRQKSK
jgi:hypothetical protein